MTSITASLSVMVLGAAAQAQLLNMGFENHGETVTRFNLTNAQLSATITGVTGFGSAGEIDLVTFPGQGGATPISGDWMLGLHAQEGGAVTDGFSMQLVLPIAAGSIYHMTMLGFQATPESPGVVQIGISADPTQFGALMSSFTPNAQWGWTMFQADFVAQDSGGYLTVRIAGNQSFVLVDNIVLTPTPGAAALFGLGGFAVMRRRR